MSSPPAEGDDRRADGAAAPRRDEDAELDRRLDRMFDDMVRTLRTWLILSQLVVVETIAIVVLLTRD